MSKPTKKQLRDQKLAIADLAIEVYDLRVEMLDNRWSDCENSSPSETCYASGYTDSGSPSCIETEKGKHSAHKTPFDEGELCHVCLAWLRAQRKLKPTQERLRRSIVRWKAEVSQ